MLISEWKQNQQIKDSVKKSQDLNVTPAPVFHSTEAIAADKNTDKNTELEY